MNAAAAAAAAAGGQMSVQPPLPSPAGWFTDRLAVVWLAARAMRAVWLRIIRTGPSRITTI